MFSPAKRQAHALYASLVAQARQPFLYTEMGIPDTLDGRFDAIVLHLFLALQRLKGQPMLSRLLQEAFVDDMDRTLRELGVGDTGVGKRVKAMAGAMQGRIRAYAAAKDKAALVEALSRNVWRGGPNAKAGALAEYMLAYAKDGDKSATVPREAVA